ncbi:MAG: gas vesicle protein GvpD P-loop domain-containing protein [Euryarchaeota archaeon]|nr:gas vesicle protein GvpD P-loop domain-containing protein [Euryarchaeota archaeon]
METETEDELAVEEILKSFAKPVIPAEVIDFFADERGKTLLVKGTPGSGKTAFALSLLHRMDGTGVYLSTRVDPATLHEQYPWIKEEILEENIVDATQSEIPSCSSSLPPTEKNRGIVLKALKYTDVPEFLKAVYTRTEDLRKPIIIIDSWDAVVSHTGYYDPRDREKLENNLCDFARRIKARMIFIVEYTELQPLDYLVDGVIATKGEIEEERRIRIMTLLKLRGCAIKRPVYLFSLHNGMFKCFSDSGLREIENPKAPAPIPDPGMNESRVTTGIKDLDALIKGYGSFNLFKADYAPYEFLMQAAAINSLNLGHGVVFTSSKQSELTNKILPFVEPRYQENITVIDVPKTDNNEAYAVAKQIHEFNGKASDFNERIGGEKKQAFFNFDEIEREKKEEMVKEIILSLMKEGFTVFGYTSEEKGMGREMEPLASVSIVLKMISGVPCMYGKKPGTEIHVMQLNTANRFPELKLTPIE